MTTDATRRAPRIFISYAGPEMAQAQRLDKDLQQLGILTYFAPRDLDPGGNIPMSLSRALAESDFYVYLLSARSAASPWVELEWTAAIEREMQERRVFLFLFRLDSTPPPLILSARKYLNAFEDWNGAVDQLAQVWRHDWEVRQNEIRVLPIPDQSRRPDDTALPQEVERPTGEQPAASRITVYIFNRAFSVQHVMSVTPTLTGRQLEAQVRAALALKQRVDALDGQVGLRLAYVLLYGEDPVPPEQSLSEAGIRDSASFDLVITVAQFSPDGYSAPVVYRGPVEDSRAGKLAPGIVAMLVRKAFGHLC